MTDIAALKQVEEKRWREMHVTSRLGEFDAIARRLCAPDAKARFLEVEKETGVPWYFTAITSVREYGGPPRWDRQLSQGDPLGAVSHNVPRGRGPFLSHPGDVPLRGAWFRGALDALIDCPPHAARWKDWSIGGTLVILQAYNGFGYANMGKPSPYIWAGTNQYSAGKYTSDGHYDPKEIDTQPGCAPMLARMMAIDGSIKIGTPHAPELEPPPAPAEPPAAPGAPLSPKAPADNWLTALLDLTR